MMEARLILFVLTRLAAWVKALVDAVSGCATPPLLDDMEPALLDSHAEELAAFDRELGLFPCADCGELGVPGARTIALCDQCREIRSRSALAYNTTIYLDAFPSMTVSEILAHRIGTPIQLRPRLGVICGMVES